MEGVRHGLHLPAVLSDGEIPLDKLTKSGVQVENPDLAVAEEHGLGNNLGLSSGSSLLAYVVLRLDREGAEDPGQDSAVHPGPGVRRHHRVGEDMVVEGVAVEGQQDLIAPASVLGRVGCEDDRD